MSFPVKLLLDTYDLILCGCSAICLYFMSCVFRLNCFLGKPIQIGATSVMLYLFMISSSLVTLMTFGVT